MEAGRIMLQRLHHLTEQRANVAFESTLASRTFAPWIRGLKETGYEFHLCYFWLSSADTSVQRVRERVRLGGHNVPEETIRRRYEAGLQNFFELYQPIATKWQFFDNRQREPRVIAEGRLAQQTRVHDSSLWRKIVDRYGNI